MYRGKQLQSALVHLAGMEEILSEEILSLLSCKTDSPLRSTSKKKNTKTCVVNVRTRLLKSRKNLMDGKLQQKHLPPLDQELESHFASEARRKKSIRGASKSILDSLTFESSCPFSKLFWSV